MEKRWLKISEAAAYLGIHPQTCYDLCARGELPSIRVGRSVRVDQRALDANLERQEQARRAKGGGR